jgi:DNA mismatch endonuclease, patch repair protein
VPKSTLVSEQMSRMPRSSTGPEVALRKELHGRGVRFRLHRRDLPGTPDIVLCRANVAIFVDGCFWHSCPDHGGIPKNNSEWWAQKLKSNRERDERKNRDLISLGWLPVHVWEHESVGHAADRIEILWRVRGDPGR